MVGIARSRIYHISLRFAPCGTRTDLSCGDGQGTAERVRKGDAFSTVPDSGFGDGSSCAGAFLHQMVFVQMARASGVLTSSIG